MRGLRFVCVIPARGASKRLPRKNVRRLAGRPLIYWTIDCANRSGVFDKVYVATDDEEIRDIAVHYGADVPLLVPPSLTGDLVPSHRPCTFLLDEVDRENRSDESVLVCLQPTSPLRSVDDVTLAVRRFASDDRDFLVSITQIDPHYFHWALRPAEKDRYEMYFGEKFMVERTLLPPVFRPNGSIKIARRDALKRSGHFFGESLCVLETPEERSIHVATQFDLELCEFLVTSRESKL